MNVSAFTGLRGRMIRLLFFLLAAITAAIGAIWIVRIEPSLQLEIERRQQMLAARAADQISHYIQDRLERLMTVAEVGRFWEETGESQRQALNRLMRLDPEISEVAFANKEGQQMIRLSRDSLFTDADLLSVADTPKFDEPMASKQYIGPVGFEFTAQPFVSVAVPVRFAGAEPAGVMMANVRLKTLWSTVAELSEQTAGVVSVHDENGILIAHPDYSKVLQAAKAMRTGRLESSGSQAQKSLQPAEPDTILWRANVPNLRWTVVVAEAKATAFSELGSVKVAFFVVLGLAVAAALALGWHYSSRITQAIHELEEGAQWIASGNLEQRLNIRTGDEIESLAGQFNRMAETLLESYQGLEGKVDDRTRELSALYAALTPLVGTETVSQRFAMAIDRLVSVTGSDAAAIRLLDRETKQLRYVAHRGFSPEYIDAPRMAHPGGVNEQVLLRGKPILSGDIVSDPRILRKRQDQYGFKSCAYLPLAVHGTTVGVIVLASRTRFFFTDTKEEQLMTIAGLMSIVFENHELLQASMNSEMELKRSNAELEQFAYVASHDLQEPLRMITNYTSLLAKRYRGQLDAPADDYIGFATAGAKRMQGLIADLLTYSRVGAPGKSFEPVNCQRILDQTLKGLSLAIEDCGAKITYDKLPTLAADPTQLGQLFHNLIGNALKYRNGARPEVHISCTRKTNFWEFAVRDNGIGIDPQYADRIFVIFQRLHSGDEYAGSGIGLAVCKKIVERHGGKIWLESQLGQGATFYFTLAVASTVAASMPNEHLSYTP